jgi:hypothetical protein
VDPKGLLAGCGKSRPHQIRSPDRRDQYPTNYEPPQISPFLNHIFLRLRRNLHEIMVASSGMNNSLGCPVVCIICNPQNYVHRVLRKSMDGIWLMRTPANTSIGYICSNLPASLNSRQLHRLIRLPILGDLISFLFK